MDSYQDVNSSPTRSIDGDASPSDRRPLPPTAVDVAQWKDESDRFLNDIERRLNDILSEVAQYQPGLRPVALESESQGPSETSFNRHTATSTDESDGDRISALKAQLARKLHNFEESNDQSTDDAADREVRR